MATRIMIADGELKATGTTNDEPGEILNGFLSLMRELGWSDRDISKAVEAEFNRIREEQND